MPVFRRTSLPARRHATRWLVAASLLGMASALAAEPTTLLAFLRAAPKTAVEEPEAPPPRAPEPPPQRARDAIERESFYDPANPDLPRLQRIEEATAHLPYDANGFPDWMRALRDGQIKPRSTVSGKEQLNVLDLDVIMRNTKEMPFVRFPHKPHTQWLDCTNCHPAPFRDTAGSTAIQMADIFRGQYCGMCHDRVAFVTFFSCHRCHSVDQSSAAAKGAGKR
jgi:c(7)-type cytochrome triheme protein